MTSLIRVNLVYSDFFPWVSLSGSSPFANFEVGHCMVNFFLLIRNPVYLFQSPGGSSVLKPSVVKLIFDAFHLNSGHSRISKWRHIYLFIKLTWIGETVYSIFIFDGSKIID